MWIDIMVTVLLTLRMTLFRPALPQLVNSNNEVLSPEGKDEQLECSFVGDGEVNEHILLESPHRGTVGRSDVFM
jgi:hypothetical protein